MSFMSATSKACAITLAQTCPGSVPAIANHRVCHGKVLRISHCPRRKFVGLVIVITRFSSVECRLRRRFLVSHTHPPKGTGSEGVVTGRVYRLRPAPTVILMMIHRPVFIRTLQQRHIREFLHTLHGRMVEWMGSTVYTIAIWTTRTVLRASEGIKF